MIIFLLPPAIELSKCHPSHRDPGINAPNCIQSSGSFGGPRAAFFPESLRLGWHFLSKSLQAGQFCNALILLIPFWAIGVSMSNYIHQMKSSNLSTSKGFIKNPRNQRKVWAKISGHFVVDGNWQGSGRFCWFLQDKSRGSGVKISKKLLDITLTLQTSHCLTNEVMRSFIYSRFLASSWVEFYHSDASSFNYFSSSIQSGHLMFTTCMDFFSLCS